MTKSPSIVHPEHAEPREARPRRAEEPNLAAPRLRFTRLLGFRHRYLCWPAGSLSCDVFRPQLVAVKLVVADGLLADEHGLPRGKTRRL